VQPTCNIARRNAVTGHQRAAKAKRLFRRPVGKLTLSLVRALRLALKWWSVGEVEPPTFRFSALSMLNIRASRAAIFRPKV
jgi:hypothetical protein